MPKKVRVFLTRCLLLVEKKPRPIEKVGQGRGLVGGKSMVISWKTRRRQHGFQGRPLKCPTLHRGLFQWFLSVRKATKGRLWPRNVKAAAEHLKKMIVKYRSSLGEPIPAMPIISGAWLFAFRRRNGISFRFPNRRYKVSRAKVKDGGQQGHLRCGCAVDR